MYSYWTKRGKMLAEMSKFSFHHRAFYCYLAMTIWIFFMITAMYKYISVGDTPREVKKSMHLEHMSKAELKYRKIFVKTCNPPDSVVRGSESAVDSEAWLLQGVLVLTRHGDRGPLTHLKGGDKLPCDVEPPSPLLKSYVEFVQNVSGGALRGPWAASGAFHNLPSLPPRRTRASSAAAPATHCALGQLTRTGLAQMVAVGAILRKAYAEKLRLDDVDASASKRDSGDFLSFSTRYRRTYQSMLGVIWSAGGPGGMSRRAASARESHSVAFCFQHCACAATLALNKKINALTKTRLESHSAVKDLVNKISDVIFESQENRDPEVVRDAILAYMCHEAPLPCSDKHNPRTSKRDKHNAKLSKLYTRSLLDVDIDTLNMELDYINNLDFNNEVGRKARDIIGKFNDYRERKTAPLDFDAQMEREKLLYYQQHYLDNADGYDDVVVVKKSLDADFNFPNDPKINADFDEDYSEATTGSTEDYCVQKEHIMSLFAYIEWNYKQEIRNIYSKKRSLLLAYGLIHNIVQNMIRMISENKPKFVLYSGHDKTLMPLSIALGLSEVQHFNVKYASRLIFEVYRKKDLRDEFKFTKRKAVAQDFYFRVVYNGDDVTNKLVFCRTRQNVAMIVVDPEDDTKQYNTYLCPIENIVRFIHDDYFTVFNVSNFKDACGSFGSGKRHL